MGLFEEDVVILWDAEFTSWPGCNENGWDKEEGEYKEIIQIGAVKANTENMEILDEFNRFVKPKINPELSVYIKNLTGITQNQVDQADSLKKVLKEFISWNKGYNLYSVENDWDVVKNNLELIEVNFEVDEERFKDICPVFKNEDVPIDDWASGNVAKYLDPEVELKSQHNALNDAKNMRKALKIMKSRE